MNYLTTPTRIFFACCTMLFFLSNCSRAEELPEIEEAKLVIQADGGCTFLEGITTHEVMPSDFDLDWDLVVHVDFTTHPTVEAPCSHVKDEFCVFYRFEQPSSPSPGYQMAIRYTNDPSNTLHMLTPDGNQGYFNHWAEPIQGSPNHDPATVNGQPRPNKGWHKVCDESHDYYVYINFGDDAPDVPMESIVLESSGICVVANIGTGG